MPDAATVQIAQNLAQWVKSYGNFSEVLEKVDLVKKFPDLDLCAVVSPLLLDQK